MSNDVCVYVRQSYSNTLVFYTCSQATVELFGGIDKVPLYVCGFYISVDHLENLEVFE